MLIDYRSGLVEEELMSTMFDSYRSKSQNIRFICLSEKSLNEKPDLQLPIGTQLWLTEETASQIMQEDDILIKVYLNDPYHGTMTQQLPASKGAYINLDHSGRMISVDVTSESIDCRIEKIGRKIKGQTIEWEKYHVENDTTVPDKGTSLDR